MVVGFWREFLRKAIDNWNKVVYTNIVLYIGLGKRESGMALTRCAILALKREVFHSFPVAARNNVQLLQGMREVSRSLAVAACNNVQLLHGKQEVFRSLAVAARNGCGS